MAAEDKSDSQNLQVADWLPAGITLRSLLENNNIDTLGCINNSRGTSNGFDTLGVSSNNSRGTSNGFVDSLGCINNSRGTSSHSYDSLGGSLHPWNTVDSQDSGLGNSPRLDSFTSCFLPSNTNNRGYHTLETLGTTSNPWNKDTVLSSGTWGGLTSDLGCLDVKVESPPSPLNPGRSLNPENQDASSSLVMCVEQPRDLQGQEDQSKEENQLEDDVVKKDQNSLESTSNDHHQEEEEEDNKK
jgi:hypothetical protein